MEVNLKRVIDKLSSGAQKKLKKTKQPEWIDPMLCMLTENYFSSNDFLYEHKFDGERIIAYKDKNKVRLMTRNKKLANRIYPDIVKQLEKQPLSNFILDGEVIASEKGKSDFSFLQKRMHREPTKALKSIAITYEVFDMMQAGEYDITGLELLDRKLFLENTIKFTKPLNYAKHELYNGLEFYKKACKKGWEGLIAKNIHSSYEQYRSKDWLKFKCLHQQELVIGGYTDPQGSRIGFGALLVGYYKNKKLLYAGKVGTGYTEDILESLSKKLKALEQKKCPFEECDEISSRGVHWVKPQLVGEIKFSEWTSYDKLRHPRFMGLREDKDAKDVVKEEAKKIS